MIFCPKHRKWRVPGGRVDNFDSLEDTVVREIKEEVGLDAYDVVFVGWGQDHDFNYQTQMEAPRLLMLFHAKAQGVVRINEQEVQAYKWVTLEEMKEEDEKEGSLADFFSRKFRTVEYLM